MRYSTCRYLTHAHVQNRWQQTNSSTLQKQNNPEQSLIEICYQPLSYSLKLAVKKCIIEFYLKQPDHESKSLILEAVSFHKGKLIKHTSKLHYRDSI